MVARKHGWRWRQLPGIDDGAGGLEPELITVYQALLAGDDILLAHVEAEELRALEEVDDVVVVGVDEGDVGHLVRQQARVGVGLVHPDFGEGHLVLERPCVGALRVVERPHPDGEVASRGCVGVLVVGEAADLDEAKLALTGPDAAALVDAGPDAGVEDDVVALHRLAGGRERHEAQLGAPDEGRAGVAEEHAIGEGEPPEAAVVGEHAGLGEGVAHADIMTPRRGDLLGEPPAFGGGVADENNNHLAGVVFRGDGLELGDHVVAVVVRVGDEADADVAADVESGGNRGEQGDGTPVGVA